MGTLIKALASLLGVLAMVACGGNGQPRSSAPAAQTGQRSDSSTSSDPNVEYFHQQLIDNGENLQSAFGTDLAALGMNPRDLQQDDVEHAYDTVLQKVRAVEDATTRREMMETFFNRSDRQ
jgi:hypothetical protein